MANRRAFEQVLAQCHRELCDDGTPFVLAMVDVDRFKQLNDSYGHAGAIGRCSGSRGR